MANRFWVGGTGNWSDNANHWATTSGGSGGASLPTSSDNVYFDALSFTSSGQTVTVSSLAYCLDMDWTGATNTPTFLKNSATAIYGSLTLITNMIVSGAGNWNFYASTTGKTIDTKDVPLIGKANFGVSSGGVWTLLGNLTTSWDVEVLYGSLITNGKSITTRDLKLSPITPINVTMGSSLVTLSRNLVVSTSNVTLNAGTSTIIMTGSAVTFGGGGLTYNNVEFQGTPTTITRNNTFSQLKVNSEKELRLTAGTTQTVTNLITDSATVKSSTSGSPALLTSTNAQVLRTATLQDITAIGTFTAIRNSVNVSGNTGIIFADIGFRGNIITTGSSGTFTSSDGKVVTIVNGTVTSIV